MNFSALGSGRRLGELEREEVVEEYCEWSGA